jgi:iron transport multicopper oxidase
MQQSLSIPADHLEVCKAAGVPVEGNAAGNTVDVFDLKGQNKSVAALPAGFTARGIVALVFSCISAFLGMAVIAWFVIILPESVSLGQSTNDASRRYGAAPLSSAELASAKRFIAKHSSSGKI